MLKRPWGTSDGAEDAGLVPGVFYVNSVAISDDSQ